MLVHLVFTDTLVFRDVSNKLESGIFTQFHVCKAIEIACNVRNSHRELYLVPTLEDIHIQGKSLIQYFQEGLTYIEGLNWPSSNPFMIKILFSIVNIKLVSEMENLNLFRDRPAGSKLYEFNDIISLLNCILSISDSDVPSYRLLQHAQKLLSCVDIRLRKHCKLSEDDLPSFFSSAKAVFEKLECSLVCHCFRMCSNLYSEKLLFHHFCYSDVV